MQPGNPTLSDLLEFRRLLQLRIRRLENAGHIVPRPYRTALSVTGRHLRKLHAANPNQFKQELRRFVQATKVAENATTVA